VRLSGFNWPEIRPLMGYFECGDTQQHICELILKKKPFEFLRGGGGGGGRREAENFLTRRRKISFS
jgi:hypothetical protein